VRFVNVGNIRIGIGEDGFGKFVATTFPDKAVVLARPLNESWEETRLHDLLHSLIAEARGEAHSKALWNKAHPNDPQYHPAEVAQEEERVLRVQRALIEAIST
jgi:hypothetical protein